MIMSYNGWSGSNVVTDVLQESRCPTTGPLSSPSQPLCRDLRWLLTEVSLPFISRQLLREDKARMFYRCDRLFLKVLRLIHGEHLDILTHIN